jgi:DNA-directed RNA polymerase specialized sigma24 family protein
MPPACASAEPVPTRRDLLADPKLHRAIVRFVQGRVPRPDVEDVVQATLTDALEAAEAPGSPDQFRRWVFGIARHNVADWFRRARRELTSEVLDEVPADSAPHSARELLRWAERELPEGGESPKTLEWMVREAGGDKLETIAAEERIPAPRVRQRVSRLRRHLRSRWLAEVGIAATVVTAALLFYWRLRAPHAPEIAGERPSPHSSQPPDERELRAERGRALRREALARCFEQKWQPCLEGLDRAAELDPAGERTTDVAAARRAAAAARGPVPDPVPSSTAPVPVPPKPVPAKAPGKAHKGDPAPAYGDAGAARARPSPGKAPSDSLRGSD